MAVTPEVPRIPHVPTPPISQRGSVRFGLPLSLLTLATLAGAGMLAISRDRGPSTSPPDNAPISDTIKPPEGDQPSLAPIPPSLGETGGSTPPEPPKKNPMDEAIKTGRIEVKGPNDNTNFKPASVDEMNANRYPLVLPFNPTSSGEKTEEGSGLVMENTPIDAAIGKVFMLGLSNIKPNSENSKFKATLPGKLTISHLNGGPGGLHKRVTLLNEDGTAMVFYVNIKAFKSDFQDATEYSITPGMELFSLVTADTLSAYWANKQVVVTVRSPEKDENNPLANFASKNPDGSVGMKFAA